MTRDVRIEPYRPALRDQILALQTHHWGTDLAVNDAYFAWKYEQNPYSDETLIWVAMKHGEAVGMRGAYGAGWQTATGRLPALCAGDLVVRPEDRNRFIPRQIMEAAARDLGARGHHYLLSLSAGRYTQLASIRQGWRAVCPHRAAGAGRTAGPLGWIAGRFGATPGPATGRRPFERFDRAAALRRRRGSPPVVERSPRPEEMAALTTATIGNGRIRQRHDAEFYAWRFRNPLSEYRFLFVEETRQQLSGFLVLQDSARVGVTSLVDWACTSPDGFAALASHALKLLGRRGCRTWLATEDAHEARLLANAGFVEEPIPSGDRYRPGLLVKDLRSTPIGPARADAMQVFDPTAWSYRMIDSDGY